MMNRRRTAVVAGAVVLGAVALSGCSKPSALVTVVSGSDSVHAEAKCKGKKFKERVAAAESASVIIGECMKDKPKVLKVAEGDVVSVGIDSDAADRWRIVYGLPDEETGTSGLTGSGLITDQTYAKALTVPNGVFSVTKTVPLAVVAFDKDDEITKVWSFQLEKK